MECLPDGQTWPIALAAYLAFVALTLVLPALGLLRLLRLPLEPAALLPLGMGLCALAHWASLIAARAWLVLALLALVALAGAWRGRGAPWRLAEGPSLRGALPPALALIALFAVTQYPLNRCAPDGGFALDSLERVDTAFHVGVTWELTHGWPPQVPGLSGVRLDYHLGPHLARAAARRFFGVHPYDALQRFDLTVWALGLVLAWRSAATALGASARVVALVPWTLLLGDLSWLLAGVARGAWLTELLGANLAVSLFFANTLIPALAAALVALAALARAERQAGPERRAWLALAALLGLGLPFVKVFLAAQLACGLLLAVLLARGQRGAAAIALAPCALALLVVARGAGAQAVAVELRPLAAVQAARETLGLGSTHGGMLALSALAFVLLAAGLRLLGVPAALRALRSGSPAAVALGAMALCGFPLRLLLRVSADGRFDEAVYFSVQSGALLWFHALLAGEALLARLTAPRARALCILAAAALAAPATAEFVLRKVLEPAHEIPASALRLTAHLARLSAPGEVVLTPSASRYPPPPVVFIGRRVPYAEYLPYLEQFAPAPLVAARLTRVRRFFRDKGAEEGLATAAALRARYVAAYGRKTPVEQAEWLELVRREGDARLYRVRFELRAPRLEAAPGEATLLPRR